MERYEIGGDERLTSLVEAAQRGDEAVLTRDGEVIAKVEARVGSVHTRDGDAPQPGIDWEKLSRLHELIPPEIRGGGAALIRELRDASDH